MSRFAGSRSRPSSTRHDVGVLARALLHRPSRRIDLSKPLLASERYVMKMRLTATLALLLLWTAA